ncbi:hypothetical protein Dimus_001578 [Dionaea muscipula]
MIYQSINSTGSSPPPTALHRLHQSCSRSALHLPNCRKRMGKKSEKPKTLPSSPTHSFSSSSSSDFEFIISLSPRLSTADLSLCPADDLFYKGQLLPLHLSPRISMVRSLLLSSDSSSSSTSASRDSTGSHSSTDSSSVSSDLTLLATAAAASASSTDYNNHRLHRSCDSNGRPSSAAEDDNATASFKKPTNITTNFLRGCPKKSKYFSLSRFSNVFKKDHSPSSSSKRAGAALDPDPVRGTGPMPPSSSAAAVKRMSSSAKEMIRKYLKKVKPLYDKLSQKQQQQQLLPPLLPVKNMGLVSAANRSSSSFCLKRGRRSEGDSNVPENCSFSGNLGGPTRGSRRSNVWSCPSSMRSSPSHSGILTRAGLPALARGGTPAASSASYADASTMEELQSAIQGAIAHCKNSMLQNDEVNFMVTREPAAK